MKKLLLSLALVIGLALAATPKAHAAWPGCTYGFTWGDTIINDEGTITYWLGCSSYENVEPSVWYRVNYTTWLTESVQVYVNYTD